MEGGEYQRKKGSSKQRSSYKDEAEGQAGSKKDKRGSGVYQQE